MEVQNKSLREEIEELKKIEITERGYSVKFLADYIKKNYGEDALEKVMQAIEENGYKMPNLSKIKDLQWMSSEPVTILAVAATRVLNWSDEDLIKFGKTMGNFHVSVKIFIKFFASLKTTFQLASKNWKKYFSQGEVELINYDKENKTATIRLSNFKLHPVICVHFRGLFARVMEIAIGKEMEVEETKCMFKGDPYHEFVFKWK